MNIGIIILNLFALTSANYIALANRDTGCSDLNSNCQSWATSGYCSGLLSAYMSINCKASCGLCQGVCGSPGYANDNHCDDNNNNAGCNWDGGACCSNNGPVSTNYCTECKCLDPNAAGVCGSPGYANDNHCDDNNNNAGCNWDGGACCSNNGPVLTNYCTECKCLDPTFEGQTTCGDADVGTKIVGGVDAVKHSIPWQAAIVFFGSDKPYCGGTIIDSTHILTAAHCLFYDKLVEVGVGQPFLPNQIQVLTGEHDTSVSQGETRHNVKSIINHPSYTGKPTYNYDYSIITIDCNDKIDLTDKARAACLPVSEAYEVSGAMFNVSGWGDLEYDSGSYPNILQVVTVPFVSDNVCKDKYGNDRITEQMVCAGNIEEGGIDACQADSGGPLTWKDTNGKWNIIGVVSWGGGCADPRYPGVYAEVFKVLDWIKSNTQAGGHEQC